MNESGIYQSFKSKKDRIIEIIKGIENPLKDYPKPDTKFLRGNSK